MSAPTVSHGLPGLSFLFVCPLFVLPEIQDYVEHFLLEFSTSVLMKTKYMDSPANNLAFSKPM